MFRAKIYINVVCGDQEVRTSLPRRRLIVSADVLCGGVFIGERRPKQTILYAKGNESVQAWRFLRRGENCDIVRPCAYVWVQSLVALGVHESVR